MLNIRIVISNIIYNMNMINKQLINAFLEHYRQNVKADLESYKDFYSVATSYNSSNIKHHHQRRINPNTLKEFARKVVEKEVELKNATSFDEIYKIIESCKIYKIGRLTIYDTAVRIAYLKGMEPTKVYLQQGSSWGAHKLGINGNFIPKSKFDKFGLKELTAHEIECFLCIYHKNIGSTNQLSTTNSMCGHSTVDSKSKCLSKKNTNPNS